VFGLKRRSNRTRKKRVAKERKLEGEYAAWCKAELNIERCANYQQRAGGEVREPYRHTWLKTSAEAKTRGTRS